jgi:hypothetical protein
MRKIIVVISVFSYDVGVAMVGCVVADDSQAAIAGTAAFDAGIDWGVSREAGASGCATAAGTSHHYC